jgi:putative two-component system response regulator
MTPKLLAMAGRIALTHHERWYGTGYPQGLAREAIPLEGRIVGVADVFDALVTEWPYKRAWSLDEAVAEITAQQGRQFDPPGSIDTQPAIDGRGLGTMIEPPADQRGEP